MMHKYPTDAEGYREGDSGCKWASEYLGRQSRCCVLGERDEEGVRPFIDKCPFEDCVAQMSELERKEYLDGLR